MDGLWAREGEVWQGQEDRRCHKGTHKGTDRGTLGIELPEKVVRRERGKRRVGERRAGGEEAGRRRDGPVGNTRVQERGQEGRQGVSARESGKRGRVGLWHAEELIQQKKTLESGASQQGGAGRDLHPRKQGAVQHTQRFTRRGNGGETRHSCPQTTA